MLRKLASLLLLFAFATSFGQTASVTDSLENALKKYNEQKAKSGKTGFSIADTAKINLLNSLSLRYIMTNSKKAIALSDETLELARKINYKEGVAYAYIVQSQINDFKGNYQLAVDYTNMGIAIHIETNNKKALADEYSQLGIIYSEMGNYPEAMKYTLIALKMYEKEKNILFTIKAYSTIAIIYKQQEKFKEALETNARAMEIIHKVKSKESAYFGCYIQNEIGEINQKQGKYETALKILLPALNASKEFEDDYLNANICVTIANCYSELRDYQKSKNYYLQALTSLQKVEDIAGEADCIINIGYSNFKQGFIATAIEDTKKGLKLAQSTGYLEWQRNAYRNLAEMYGSIKNYKLAYENHIKFKQLNDSLFNKDKDKKITEFRLAYEFDKKQEHFKSIQEKKDAILKLETQTQRDTKYVFLICLIFVSLLAIGIFYNLRRNQKQKTIISEQKRLVESQNEQISLSLTEKETLLREIHHRVKNNLQIISSLLSIQAQDIQDENVLSSLQEGQSRVQAMSLIHQNLYQSQFINNVNIENYLKDLVQYISEIFKRNYCTIDITIEASGIEFDIDTAIPLGLIVNELVSNAYKYAFKNQHEGSIKINIGRIGEVDYKLDVSDNGKGLPDDFDIKKNTSLGLKLVGILARQLRGTLSAVSAEGATTFTVKFKDLKAYLNA